jgi:predicted nucleic-acid-binding protein
MIGLDTNVLVRYTMQDDPKQSAKAGKLIDALDGTNRGFIYLVSVVETVWVLSSCYDLNREQVAQALATMLRTKQFACLRQQQSRFRGLSDRAFSVPGRLREDHDV